MTKVTIKNQSDKIQSVHKIGNYYNWGKSSSCLYLLVSWRVGTDYYLGMWDMSEDTMLYEKEYNEGLVTDTEIKKYIEEQDFKLVNNVGISFS